MIDESIVEVVKVKGQSSWTPVVYCASMDCY